MVESVGKRLNQARLERQISVEEAAHATRMRPERVLDLENDDYTNFPSLAYARGFLVIYAKYLGVDVSDVANILNSSGRFGIENYDYLHNAPDPVSPVRRKKTTRRPLKYLVIVAIAVGATIWVMNWVSTLERLGNIDALARKQSEGETVPAATPKQKPSGAASAKPLPAVSATPAPLTTNVQPAVPVQPTPASQPLADGSVEVRRAEAVTPEPTATPVPHVVEIALMPMKKTWVKVLAKKDDKTPIFEDWLYPDVKPLKFHGSGFWIELGDKNGVVILRNDEPVHYEHPGISIE